VSSEPLLKIRDLYKVYKLGVLGRKSVVALNRVSMDVGEGRLVSIVGESGSGKTTLARIVLRLTPPTDGKVLYRGKDIFKLNKEELKKYRAEVQAVFQDPYTAFNPFYKVDRALRVAVEKFRPGENPDEVVRDVLVKVRLNPDEVLGRYPHQLSGGQLQRMLIARALIPRPRLLVADEIISMVDMSIRIDILNLLRELVDRDKLSIIFITHEINLAFYASDEIVVLYRGEVMERGDAEEMLKDPLHPYTKLLIDAIPAVGKKEFEYLRKVRKAEETRGAVEAAGCPFYPRCPYAMPRCKDEKPPEIVIKNRAVKCWLYA